jgi:predicted nucleic acid-binding protein
MILGRTGKIIVVISDFVILETRSNIVALYPEKLFIFEKVLNAATPTVVNATPSQVADSAKFIVVKDAPILAAAKTAKVDMLVSLDRKHILGRPELAEYIGAAILSPKEAVERLRGIGKL